MSGSSPHGYADMLRLLQAAAGEKVGHFGTIFSNKMHKHLYSWLRHSLIQSEYQDSSKCSKSIQIFKNLYNHIYKSKYDI